MASDYYTSEDMRCFGCGSTFTARVVHKLVPSDEAGQGGDLGHTIHIDHIDCPICGSAEVDIED
jgi:hypothetical protein